MGFRSKQRILNRRFSSCEKHLKKHLFVTEMQIKNTMRFQVTPKPGWLRSKTQGIAHTGEDVEHGECSSISGGSVH